MNATPSTTNLPEEPDRRGGMFSEGSSQPLTAERTHRWLEVKLPEGLGGSPAVALKIRGSGLA